MVTTPPRVVLLLERRHFALEVDRVADRNRLEEAHPIHPVEREDRALACRPMSENSSPVATEASGTLRDPRSERPLPRELLVRWNGW